MGEVYAIGILDEGGTVLDPAFEDFAGLGQQVVTVRLEGAWDYLQDLL